MDNIVEMSFSADENYVDGTYASESTSSQFKDGHCMPALSGEAETSSQN